MAQLFRPGFNTIARVAPVCLVVGFLGFWGIGYAIYRSPYTTGVDVPRAQPVPFSHQHHCGGLGIDCRYCHGSVEDSSFAGMPTTHTCMTCHSQVWTEAPILAPVRESLATGAPLEWTRVHDLPDYVFFNHSIHVRKGVGCSECHGRIDTMPLTRKTASLEMRWCLECHKNPGASLRPVDQVFNMDWTQSMAPPEAARKLAAERHIDAERLRDCSICHR